ncbi:MAG: VOC family protein [Anaerolineales bacterium]|nr:VOC family protein [Anaerolineales bacterium]
MPTPFSPTEFRIHPDTLPGHVHLTVADLDKQLTFYQSVIGLKLHWQEGTTAGLGAGGADLVRLTENRAARRYRGTTGMYHFALLFPNRRELARAIARLYTLRYRNYPTDHIMTKTTYLDDPEGNNIELYTESPEDGFFGFEENQPIAHRADGTPSDGREPLDLEALFAHLTPEDKFDPPVPPETRIGHYHLYVANLETTRHFYHDILGFDDMGVAQSFRMGMVSIGRYHHHIGYNTWIGEGAPPAPADALGLRYFTFVLPHAGELDQVEEHVLRAGISIETTPEGLLIRDPSNNAIVLTTPK